MQPIINTVLLVDQQSQWALAYAGTYKHIRVQTRPFEPLLMADSVELGLRQWAASIRHYDIALVAVSPCNLSWLRSQLHHARNYLRTPIVVIAQDLKPVAIQDLLDAGAADFIIDHNFTTELPIRVKILQRRLEATPQTEATEEITQIAEDSNALDAYTAAVASNCATSGQPFQQAKKAVVQRFEKAYIRTALVRNQGNITRAARAAQKHRRSFWELMRKHNIDAEIYRVSASPNRLSIR